MQAQTIQMKNAVAVEMKGRIASTAKKWRVFASVGFGSLYYHQAAKNRIAKIVIAMLVVDTIFGFIVLGRIFMPTRANASVHAAMQTLVLNRPAAPAASVFSPNDLTGAAGGLAKTFSAFGLPVTFAAPTTKSGLSQPGTMLAVAGDTVSVFEYPDSASAQNEATTLAKKYSDNAFLDTWYGQAHVYIKDSAVIFYLGSRSTILTVLASYAGSPIVGTNPSSGE